MGYERDDIEAMKYARKGIDRGDIECCKIAFDIFWWCSGILPEEMNLTKEEALMMRLRALRYAPDAEAWSIMHDYVLDYRKELQKMGYADELNYWKDFAVSLPDILKMRMMTMPARMKQQLIPWCWLFTRRA